MESGKEAGTLPRKAVPMSATTSYTLIIDAPACQLPLNLHCICVSHLPDPPQRPTDPYRFHYQVADTSGSATFVVSQKLLSRLILQHPYRRLLHHVSNNPLHGTEERMPQLIPHVMPTMQRDTVITGSSHSKGFFQKPQSHPLEEANRNNLPHNQSNICRSSASSASNVSSYLLENPSAYTTDMEHDEEDDRTSCKNSIAVGDVLNIFGVRLTKKKGCLVLSPVEELGAMPLRISCCIEKVGKFTLPFSLYPNISSTSDECTVEQIERSKHPVLPPSLASKQSAFEARQHPIISQADAEREEFLNTLHSSPILSLGSPNLLFLL